MSPAAKWIIWFVLFYIETCIWSSMLWMRGPAAGFLQPSILYILGPIGGVVGVLLLLMIERYISGFPDGKKEAVMWRVVISSLLLAIIYTNIVKVQIKQEMLAYLHERYGLEFEITEGDSDTFAYPNGQPQITFKVFRRSKNPSKYADFYTKEKWAYQSRPFIEKKLRQVYGQEADIRLEACQFYFSDDDRNLDFEQAFEKARSSGHGAFEASYWVFMDGAEFKQEEEADKAYEIIKAFMLKNSNSVASFYVTYIDIKDKEDFLANSGQYYDNWYFINLSGRSQRNQYEKSIEGKNILARLAVFDYPTLVVNNAGDLIKYFGPYAYQSHAGMVPDVIGTTQGTFTYRELHQ